MDSIWNINQIFVIFEISEKQSVYCVCLFTFFEEFLTAWWGPVGGLKCVAVMHCQSVHLSVLTKFFFTLTRGMKLARKEASGWYSNAC